jgi:hypothetical protein
MKISNKLSIGCGACLALFAAVYSLHWYQSRITRPALIQREVLGREITSYGQLTTYEGSGAYGEGLWRWIYRLPVSNEWSSLCQRGTDKGACEFSRTRQVPGQEIQETVEYSSGKLTITEIWY